MNPVMRAVDVAKYTIPREILVETFQPKNLHWRQTPPSLDEQMLSLVVRPRVLVDCDLVGGTEIIVDLSGLAYEVVNQFEAVYRIPKNRTGGRTIMEVLNVGYGSASMMAYVGGTSGFSPGSVTPVTTATQAMGDAMGPIPVVSTAKATLIGENVIVVKDSAPITANTYVRCIVSNAEDMAHLQLRSIPKFAKLVELAIKAYIYNELIIRMDQAQLSGGRELGAFKQVVETYADANQQYEEYLQLKWKKIAFMSDRETFARHIRTRIGSFR